MSEKKSIIKNTAGDVIVEAAILFPVMILIFFGLVLLAIYLPTRAVLQRSTQIAATALATECSDTWFAVTTDSSPSYGVYYKTELESVYAIKSSPMFAGKGGDIVAAVELSSISSKSGDLTVSCRLVNNIIYKELIITAGRTFTMPFSLEIFGVSRTIPIVVTSTAVVQDADEFVRNVDLSIDFVKYISERFGIKDITSGIGGGADIIALLVGSK